jgi:hypothetical protein
MTYESPTGSNSAQPHRAKTPAEFMLRLRQLKEWAGLTYRQIEIRSRRHGDCLARSTLAATLRRDALPREDFVRSLVRACGHDPDPWIRVRRELAVMTAAEPQKESSPVSGPEVAPGLESPPRQLPLDADVLVGRDRELREVTRLVSGSDPGAPVIVISGPPGVGKSAVGIRAAHLAAEHFPDGQLYVNLRGASPGADPLTPAEIAGILLRRLRISGSAVPADAGEAAALLRCLLADRRVLVLLDDVACAAQVRPLVPFGRRSVALMTSRMTLTSLDGSRCLRVGHLSHDDAEAVLERLLGPERVTAEPEAVKHLADLCDHLPLGLRIAAARLAARPWWPVCALVERLADERHRLDEFKVDDLGMRAILAVSYDALAVSDDPHARMAASALPLLADLSAGEVLLAEAVKLLNTSMAEAGRTLERLVDANLMESAAPGCYRLPNLVRLFARELRATADCAEPRRAGGAARAGQ